MEFKKSIIILIMAVFLASIAGVCASDTNDTAIASEDIDDVISVEEDTKLASSEENEILTADEQPFTQLNDTINGNTNNTIYLKSNYKYSSGDDSFKKGVVIDRDVTIYGNGHTIDGNKTARIFNVAGGNVVFYNITFINGKIEEEAGSGGAINGYCSAINCTFKNNQAHNPTSGFSYGGAMYDGSAVNCTFTENGAGVGGAIVDGSAVNCTFTGNMATLGGAIVDGYAVNCTFTGNSAFDGGAMYGGSAVNCTFTENEATNEGNAMFDGYRWNCRGQNPADYSGTQDLELDWVVNNFTTIYGSGETLPIKLMNQNWDFIAFINYDVVIYNKTGVVKTYHCLSNDDLSLDLLSGIYTAELTVTYPGLDKPSPKNITLTIIETDGTFWDLNKTINGNTNDTITLDKNYTFNPDIDSAFTGGIVISRQVTINGDGHAIDAKGKSKIFLVAASNVTIENITFLNGNSKAGGAIEGWLNDCTVSGCSFKNNHAEEGGAISWWATGVKVSNCLFENNSADKNGGAICWFGSCYVSGCIFENNSAGNGSVYYKYFDDPSSYLNGNILLGNGGHELCPAKSDDCNFNWFGHTADDYLVPPAFDKANITVWMFLNATVGLNVNQFSSAYDVVFKLFIYNSTSGNITECDNASFKNLNLTITATNGNVSKNIAKLGEPITYTLTSIGIGTVTAITENVEYAIEFDGRLNPNLSVDSQEADYSNSTIIAINYNSSATGTVNITLKGKNGNSYTFTNLALNATILLPEAINADEYKVDVIYSGDNTFSNATANGTLTVNKASTEITVNPASLELFVGDETVIFANLTPDGAGNVTFTSSNDTIVDVDNQGNVIAQGKGQAIITVSFAGDNNYAAAENRTITVTVSLDNASVTVVNDTLDLKIGETYAINATKHPDTIMLDITYTSSNNAVATVDGKGIITAVGEGTAIITVEVGDDEIYAKNSTNVTVTVSKVPTEIDAKSITATYNINRDLVITLKDANGNPLAGVEISVDLNGAKTYTTDTNGQAKVSTLGLAPKTYTAKINFEGNTTYNGSSAEVKVVINKATPKITAKKKTYKAKKKTKKFTITLKDNTGKPIKNAKVRLMIKKITKKAKKTKAKSKKKKKKNIVKTNKKGKATFKIDRKKKGKYMVTVKFYGNKYFTSVTKKVKITVK